MLRYTTDRARPGLVALYDIRPGNRAGQFLQPRSPHGVLWHGWRGLPPKHTPPHVTRWSFTTQHQTFKTRIKTTVYKIKTKTSFFWSQTSLVSDHITDQSTTEWASEWVSTVQYFHQHFVSHFGDENNINMETQTLHAGCSKVEAKKFHPAADPLPGGTEWPKFTQLERVITFTYRPSLLKINGCNFELSW